MIEVVAVAIKYGLIILIPSVITSFILRKPPQIDLNEEVQEKEFKVLWWFYPLNIFPLLLGAFFLYAVMYQFELHWATFFSFGMGGFFIILSIVTFIRLPRYRIIFTHEKLIYYDGFKIKTEVWLNEINSYNIFHGNIWIDDGSEFEKAVPIYFKDISHVLALLDKHKYKDFFTD
ncbi:hypothetical protein [Paenibacillus daejeonensis]|uniref:hypothetical protein n=1 Tax=Paenibacillus daejeonensis TaxID=135193 RepID=UPI00037DB7A5|nr:hypothetical protein [Paenibacillus daejeonensis]